MKNNINEFVFDGDFDAKIYDLVNDMQIYNVDRKNQVKENNKKKQENDYEIQSYKLQREVIENENKKLSNYQSRFVEEDETYKEYQEEIDKNNAKIKNLDKKIKQVAKANKEIQALNKEIESNKKDKPEIQEFYARRDELIKALKQKEKDIIVTKRNEVKQQRKNIEILKNDIEALKRGIESEEKFAQYSNSTANLEYKKNLLAQKEELYGEEQVKLNVLEFNMNGEIDKELEEIDIRITYLEKISIEKVDELKLPTVEQVKGEEQVETEVDQGQDQDQQEEQHENSPEEKEKLKKQLEDIYTRIETGYEDLLSEGYLYMKEVSLASDDIAKQIPVIENMTLLDIYKEQYEFFASQEDKEKYSDDLKELKELIEKVEKRKEELEKPQTEKSEEQEQEDGITRLKDEEVEETKPKKILTVDDLEKQKGDNKPTTKGNATQTKTQQNRTTPTVKPEENTGKPTKVEPDNTPKGTTTTGSNTEKKTAQFEIDVKNNVIIISLDGKEEMFEVSNIQNLFREGKAIKAAFVKNTDSLFRSEVKKIDPSILGALQKISEEYPELQEKMSALQDEYVKKYLEGSYNIDSIKYIFGNRDEIDYSSKLFKQTKRVAKRAEKYGVAEIEGLEETNYIAVLKNWFKQKNTKRLESKAMKKAAERQAHFINNPKFSKDLAMGRVGLDEEKANTIVTKKEERKGFIDEMNQSDETRTVTMKRAPKFKSATINRGGEGR